jgi:SNF2 family DNA or RNA helicase
MLQQQLAYYNNLPEKEKHIINQAVFLANFHGTWELLPKLDAKYNLTKAAIDRVLKECVNEKIMTRSSGTGMFSVNIDCLITLFPFIKEKKSDASHSHFYYYTIDANYVITNYLYALLIDNQKIERYEEKMLELSGGALLSFAAIFDYPAYQRVLPKIHPEILRNMGRAYLSKYVAANKNLEPLLGTSCEKYADLKFFIHVFKGDFAASIREFEIQYGADAISYFAVASLKLLNENQPEEALAWFEKGLKQQRKTIKGSYLPVFPLWSFYYLSLLLRTNTAAIPRIIQALEKKQYTQFDYLYLTVCRLATNPKMSVEYAQGVFEKELLTDIESEKALWNIVGLYLLDYKKADKFIYDAFLAISRAYENGYFTLALEAAYALTQWSDQPEMEELYQKIRTQVGFDAAVSQVEKKEDWEVSLEMMANIVAKKHPVDDKAATHSRIVYYINPEKGAVQPVLQKALANGKWGKGKNVAFRTFQKQVAEGMTELDLRIAKCAIPDNQFYGSTLYAFKKKVFKELLGHPHLFLYGSDNVPLELVEGHPEITVEATKGGYKITSNLKKLANNEGNTVVIKETNTRYKVFSLTSEQRQLLSIIWEQTLVIPEKGKNKLLEAVSRFSSEVTVHSDFIQEDSNAATTASSATIVDADSRIRVQLLPWSTGLKAELFAKPFGTHPPYCKPGVGGKMLFHNTLGENLRVNRDLEQESAYTNILLEDIQALETININEELMSFENPADSLYLLEVLEKHKDIAVVEWPEGERYKIQRAIDSSSLSLRLTSKTDWFELQGELQVDENTVLTIKELIELSQLTGSRFVEMKNGAFLALSKRLKQQLDQLNAIAQTSKKNLQINKFALVSMSDVLDEMENLKVDKIWKDIRKKIAESDQKEVAVPSGLQAELRPYQADGFRWMMRLSGWGAGACLADDMGLGKTIQAICVLLNRSAEGAALVVAPVSVIPNWVNEIKKFAPSLNPVVLPTTNRENTIQSLQSGDILLASYGILQSEEELFTSPTWATVILDEAHTIKNFATKTSKAAMSLQAGFKVILTGTPIQNHLGEIWNLFNFINPGMLGTLPYFTEKFVKAEGDGKKQLKRLITPFILRRTKTAVLEELPPKTEIIKKITLSDEETAFYEALRQKAIEEIESADEMPKHIKILAEITRLRQACCNPALVNADIQIPSTKLSTFLEIVQELQENKHRALVFSQFTSHLSLVRTALEQQHIPYLYLDGSTPMAEREKLVKRFQSGESDLFLISLKAGGLGLNLTGADFVVHLDPWWNPAIEDQASDRAHRIGQKRPVTVYRLVAEHTIEEKIIQLHNTKRDLADTLLEGSDQAAGLSAKELLNLIKN